MRWTRWLFEKMGLVRTEEEQEQRFAAADSIIKEANREIEDARRRRGLAMEVQSYRPHEGNRR